MIRNLTDAFLMLKESRIRYSCLQGFMGLPSDPPTKMVILVPEEKHIVNVLQLVRVHKNNFRLDYGEPGSERNLAINLLIKGYGYFPDRFETALLDTTEMYNDLIKIPIAPLRMYSSLYWRLHRSDWLKENMELRKAMELVIADQVGPKMGIRAPQFSEGMTEAVHS